MRVHERALEVPDPGILLLEEPLELQLWFVWVQEHGLNVHVFSAMKLMTMDTRYLENVDFRSKGVEVKT